MSDIENDTYLAIDDHEGSDISVRRLIPNYLITVNNGYRGDRGVSASIELPPEAVARIVQWLMSPAATHESEPQ